MPDKPPISAMSGPELISYLHILTLKQSELSKLKIDLTEKLVPIDQERARIRADITKVTEGQRQVKTEISAVKYALKAEAQ
jgi:hypothetical protein